MAAPKITLYVDIVSPFAYIAFHVLKDSPAFSKCNINYVPIFLGGLMNACGNTAPIKIKSKAFQLYKDTWIDNERRRWARYFSIPMIERFPDDFPPMTLGAQRALCAISQKFPDKLTPAIDGLYRGFWIEGDSKVGQPEGFVPILESVLGKNKTQEISKATIQPEIKSLLGANTDRAFKSGAFGLPWFECTNSKGETEGFWGIDHLGQVAEFLGLERNDRGFRALL